MAKPTKPTSKQGTIAVESEKTGFLKKLFMLFFIPVLFGLAVILIIAQLTNINVFESVTKLTNAESEEDVEPVEEEQGEELTLQSTSRHSLTHASACTPHPGGYGVTQPCRSLKARTVAARAKVMPFFSRWARLVGASSQCFIFSRVTL